MQMFSRQETTRNLGLSISAQQQKVVHVLRVELGEVNSKLRELPLLFSR